MRKNKKITAVLSAALIMSLLSGCVSDHRSESTEGIVNKTYEEGMDLVTISGDTIKANDCQLVPFPAYGFAHLLPTSWGIFEDLNMVAVEQGVCFTFLPPSLMPDLEEMTEEEIEAVDFEEIYSKQINLIKTFYASSDMAEDALQENNMYQKIEKLAALNGNTYYIAYNDSITQEEYPYLTQADIDSYMKYAAALPELKNNVIIFPQQDLHSDEGITSEQMRSLRGVDLEGNDVNREIFKDYDITMVNIWATWCGPCVNELPDLASLSKTLPENVNLITICADADEEGEAAKEILEQCEADFITICGNEGIRSDLLRDVYSYPMTVFVNSEGELIGEKIMGALSEAEYREEINNRLDT